jgi:formate hydrogenlyase subunit 5
VTAANTATVEQIDARHLAETVADKLHNGWRFAGIVASSREDGSTLLRALLVQDDCLEVVESALPPGEPGYPALTPLVPSADWYEREIHDLFGIEPIGHPRLDPLVLPLAPQDRLAARPRPGAIRPPEQVEVDLSPLPGHVRGEGVFTIPYGPVRSGVFESIEYLIETTGEEIPHLRTRVYHKHRGLESRFRTLLAEDGVLLAERVEGCSSVAHALAFCQALEALAGVEPPRPAELVRALHAELERVAAHLDSTVRHTEASGQAVACARFSRHKEDVLRLRARLCGHRFGRGVVVPGGVSGPPQIAADLSLAEIDRLDKAIRGDIRELMATPSFLDRLRGTGRISAELASAHGALGPVARASGLAGDVRRDRPYGAYRYLGFEAASGFDEGDALARQQVRQFEIGQALDLARQSIDELSKASAGPWRVDPADPLGFAVASVEAPQGELIYLVEAEDGRLARVKPRTASFHNLPLFARAFQGDIFTDFAFIEASFGLSIAGVAG